MSLLSIRVYKFNKEKTKRKLIDLKTWDNDQQTKHVFNEAKDCCSCKFDDCQLEIELDELKGDVEETIDSFYITETSYNGISKER